MLVLLLIHEKDYVLYENVSFYLTPQHYFVNIFTKNLSKNKIKVCFMMSIERAVESTIKPFLYLIRRPRNNKKQSGNSIVGHPVYLLSI